MIGDAAEVYILGRYCILVIEINSHHDVTKYLVILQNTRARTAPYSPRAELCGTRQLLQWRPASSQPSAIRIRDSEQEAGCCLERISDLL